MNKTSSNLQSYELWLTRSGLNLALLQELQQKPEPFTPGEPLFWDDPHISTQILQAHIFSGARLHNVRASVRRVLKIEQVQWFFNFIDMREPVYSFIEPVVNAVIIDF